MKTKTSPIQFKWTIHKFVLYCVARQKCSTLVMRDIGRRGRGGIFKLSFSFVARHFFVCWLKWHLLRREALFSLCSLLSVLSLLRQCVAGYSSGCVTLIMNLTTQNELNTVHLLVYHHYTVCDINNMYVYLCHKIIEICFLSVNIATDLFLCVFIWSYCLTPGNNKSLKETIYSTESPLIGFSTPKRPPVMDVVQVWFMAILIFSLLFTQKKIMDYMLCFAIIFFYYCSSNIIAVVGIIISSSSSSSNSSSTVRFINSINLSWCIW